eukprot:GHVN01105549.1.p1 GENE.GHVN01105549.1~~GHVN01105549.1.p1  ORF type:complete len:148 (+),score=25.51 GHVN01105549.1:110-553(+)
MSESVMVIGCVAFIGKQSQPLAVRVYGGEDEVAMQFALFAAQDTIEQRLAAKPSESFLGYIGPALCLPNDYKFYAFVSSSDVKVVAGLEDRIDFNIEEINQLLHQLYRLYADAVCNPFLIDSIESPIFEGRLQRLVEQWSIYLMKER